MKNKKDLCDLLCNVLGAIIIIAMVVSITFGVKSCLDSRYKNTQSQVYDYNEIKTIGNGLWYDTTTRIVYRQNSYGMSPYIAPNGLPFKYNPETKALEQIKQ